MAAEASARVAAVRGRLARLRVVRSGDVSFLCCARRALNAHLTEGMTACYYDSRRAPSAATGAQISGRVKP
jgi:hypothetical protein